MISPINVSESGDRFLVDGHPHFVFADTVWNAFSSATEEEWDTFTRYRSQQGFNTLHVSVLPVLHDASITYAGTTPFASEGGYEQGPWDFSRPSEEFFAKAERMVGLAAERGMRTCLVLLWNNYVPGTWAQKRRPDVTIPKDAVSDYSAYVAERFKAYHPLYFIAGDTRFETDEITDYFMIGLDAVKRADPSALTAMHITGNNSDLPERVVDSANLDFYTYQSGHRVEDVHKSWQLAEEFIAKYPMRPLFNAEPCYEGHGHAGGVYGRFNAFDVRRAFWASVLSGAKAGFTYGAHGVWGWHRRGAEFTSVPNSRVPFDWSTAMTLDGGWDAAYSVGIVRRYNLGSLEPAQEIVPEAPEGVRAACGRDRNGCDLVAIYLPYAEPVTLSLANASEYDFTYVDLIHRRPLRAEVNVSKDGTVTMCMPELNGDYVIIGERRRG